MISMLVSGAHLMLSGLEARRSQCILQIATGWERGRLVKMLAGFAEISPASKHEWPETSHCVLQVLGNAKGVLAVGVSIAIFKNDFPPVAALGYAVTITGARPGIAERPYPAHC